MELVRSQMLASTTDRRLASVESVSNELSYWPNFQALKFMAIWLSIDVFEICFAEIRRLVRSQSWRKCSNAIVSSRQKPIKSFSSNPKTPSAPILLQSVVAKVDCLVLFRLGPDGLNVLVECKDSNITSKLTSLSVKIRVLVVVLILYNILSIFQSFDLFFIFYILFFASCFLSPSVGSAPRPCT